MRANYTSPTDYPAKLAALMAGNDLPDMFALWQGLGTAQRMSEFLQSQAADLTLEDAYRNPSAAGALYRVAEALVDISEEFWQLCAVHVQIAERTIGQRPGTGGTAGVSYLAETLEGAKAFGELWAVRTRL